MSRSRSKPKHHLVIIIAAAVFIFNIALGGFVIGIYSFSQRPVDHTDTQEQTFIIKKGESITSMGNRLAEAGYIRSPFFFKVFVRLNDYGGRIQAGDHQISPSMPLPDLVDSLTHGSQDIWITALEGWRVEEIAESIDNSFADQGLDFDKQAFIALAKPQEGYLFPDTYLVPKTADPATILSIFTNTFDKKIAPLEDDINSSGRTLHQIVTMASLIEREARGEARPIVAGILWKRVDNGWSLDVDATLQYIKGYSSLEDDWWATPYAADKDLVSPYNTYRNPGLPPGPIANPSLSSLEAAANPEPSEYWFYITDLDGRMHYAETLEGHNANVQRYLR